MSKTQTKQVFAENLSIDHIHVLVKAKTQGNEFIIGNLEAIQVSERFVLVYIGGSWFTLDRSALVEVEDW